MFLPTAAAWLFLAHGVASQITTTVSQTRGYTTARNKTYIEWCFRTNERFASLNVTWNRTLYDTEILFETSWTTFTTERCVARKLAGAEDAMIQILRFDPDEKKMEELRVKFEGTINHDSTGSFVSYINTQSGRWSVEKVMKVEISFVCELKVSEDAARYSCEPEGYGWLSKGYLTATVRVNGSEHSIHLPEPGGAYIEYERGSFLSGYLGPGGPLVTVTVLQPCPPRKIDLIIELHPRYKLYQSFVIPERRGE
ncbi:m136 protein [Murid betaherpesvirus 1]|uniref:M136 protein n=2 Tax=Murid herpesvirus 1 TaxID=10366 RepID=H2A1Z7_MUHV1|nr:m136 [Muromegalovirus WP15B]CCE56638.1 m136 protein [Murid betaherpesvirus 1]CCE56966.1 m136 protein [Murid betaherpesvirus 1]CCE57133.1 m136 protein [Murid betaherpesvirus 1]